MDSCSSGDQSVLTYTRDSLFPYAGLPFKWRVIAQNYQGDSVESELIRILAAEVPSTPLTPEKVAADKSFITTRWLAPEFNGGVLIEYYSVYVKPKGGSFTLSLVLTDLADLVYTEIIP